ncbi:YiiX/YebB-like N1pC/P60 family cysteine hydrolase [Rhizobium leguminosarum]|uniref:YiiX/YebB-like N1pC/P60 family cysteine hydrolase n=1 Tax=Rhizobium leguminosarum TaxID=384 RepID=UPI00144220F4|nr:YiiX/YebB-like N1pC/P60 family cysteine hydrolase [Rhizobium leguminosarum]
MVKRIGIESLRPGDIVLTARRGTTSKVIRGTTLGIVSHAMICVQQGSFIDSTSDGVQARNLQRELFHDDENVYAFRLKESAPGEVIGKIVDFARSEIGARYSMIEAARSVLGGPKPRGARQFCSRLIARAYHSVGIQLVPDHDYPTPDDLRRSPLLMELPIEIEQVSEEERAAMETGPKPIDQTHAAQNYILNEARSLDGTVENFGDLDRLIEAHPEWDARIAKAYRDSGYFDLWRLEFQKHPWRYDREMMLGMSDPARAEAVRAYCRGTIQEAYSGGIRFAVNLVYYSSVNSVSPRQTRRQLIDLYQTLVQNDEDRRETARAWLARFFPDDLKVYMETFEPHTPAWFATVDRVEPKLGMMARASISVAKSLHVCSLCADEPVTDYRLVNGARAMPGVPSLRLCDDCIEIRRGFGEELEPFD